MARLCSALSSIQIMLLLKTTSSQTYCAEDGSSSTYTETIEPSNFAHLGYVRHIEASGCPNHANGPIGDNPNMAEDQGKDFKLAAFPCFSDSADYDVTCVGSAVGITLNGISIFSKFAGGTCDADNDAVVLEGDTFDACSGHSAGNGGEYHYHIAPSCLLAQSGDHELVGAVNSHSPLIGWAFDGFPIYGPHGLEGSTIRSCSHADADSTDCLDDCNGHDQHEVDGFLYHYHIVGAVGDLVSSPTDPLPSAVDASPYTLGCLKGVPFTWSVLMGSSNGAACATNGTTDEYSPVAVEGVTEVYAYVSPTQSPVVPTPSAAPSLGQDAEHPTPAHPSRASEAPSPAPTPSPTSAAPGVFFPVALCSLAHIVVLVTIY